MESDRTAGYEWLQLYLKVFFLIYETIVNWEGSRKDVR